MLDRDVAHREIPRIAGCEPAAKRERSGSYEAVRLRECAATARELAPPVTSLPAFFIPQRCDSKPGKKCASRPMLALPESPNRLLNVHGAGVRSVSSTAQGVQAPARLGTAAEEVDEDRRVEENRRQLPDTALIGAPLLANPSGGILVPLVTGVGNSAHGRFEQLPAVIVVQRLLDRARDVRAPAASADAPVELADEIVAEGYVQSHGHTLTH